MADSAQYQEALLNNLRKLTAVAFNLFRKQQLFGGTKSEPVLKGLGKSPQDFAADALTEFLATRDRYPKAKSEDEIFAIAVTILKRDFLDAVSRNHAYLRAKDGAEGEIENFSVPDGDHPSSQFDAEDLARKFYRFADGKQDLKDLIDAAAMLSTKQREILKRSDLADLLGISVEEVTRKNNRLNYRFHAEDES